MKHAVYTGSRNLYGDMTTAAKSLVANSDVDKVWLLTEGGFDFYVPDVCEVVDVSGQRYFPEWGPNMSTRYSYLALMRAALALMPEFAGIDRILSLDVDTIAMRDCSDVWELPIGDCYFSASREPHRSKRGLLYCNTGVALYNLGKLRDGKAQEVVDLLNAREYPNVEQDAFSYLCQGRIHDMPGEYNASEWTRHLDKPVIRHFAGEKTDRWRRRREVDDYRQMTWHEALQRHAGVVEARHG